MKNKKALNLHKMWVAYIMSEVKEVTFISFLKRKDPDDDFKLKDYISVKLKNSSGGRDVIDFEVKCPIDKVGGKEYEYLLHNLKNREYESVV
jgi:hypothetical protein